MYTVKKTKQFNKWLEALDSPQRKSMQKLIIKLEIIANNIGMSNVCSVPFSYIFLRGQGVKLFSLVAKQCKQDIETQKRYL